MLKVRTTRLSVAVLAVVAIIAVAGSVAIASNMGFKLNKAIVPAGVGQIGNNWTSIPFNNPYVSGSPAINNGGAFCGQTGLTSGLVKATLTTLNENTGVFTSVACSTAANSFPLIEGKGLQIRQPATTGAPASIIIVGSHNPIKTILVPRAGLGQIGNYWFSVPYHTTASFAVDLCTSSGLNTTALAKAGITRLNATSGAFSTVNCQTSGANTFPLVLGEHLQIRNPQGPNTFTPAHF